ncbi:MAG: ferredoxin, partial [Leptospiraceae bacterium]|nr:ferredoxin [Leptospiraceae bacterium]
KKKHKDFPEQRKKGIQRAIDILEKYNKQGLPSPFFKEFSFDSDYENLLPSIEEHFHPFNELFYAYRIYDFEKNASFNQHKAFYEKEILKSVNLTKMEWELTSCFVVWKMGELESPVDFFSVLREISKSEYPIKLMFLETEPVLPPASEDSEEYFAHLVPTDLALLAPALQKIHYFQSPVEVDREIFQKKLENCWSGHYSSFIRLYLGKENPYLAAVGRYVPYFEYNPGIDFNFSSCISLEGNLELNEIWGKEIARQGSISHRATISFADFLCREGLAKDHFTEPQNQGKKRPIDVSEYLDLDRWNREHYYPIAHDSKGKSWLVSQVIVALSVEHAKIWRVMQNWAGIANPEFEEKLKALKIQLKLEKEQALKEQAAKIIEEKDAEKEKLLSQSFRNLVVNLLNKNGAGITELVSNLSYTSLSNGKAFSSEPQQPQAGPSEKPKEELWIDSSLCTACDECVTINRNIFAYNSEKQAIVKNPRGGPFKDMVKAAEKCSAGIIHPGKPWDEKEKDLEKLIKRAEKYN